MAFWRGETLNARLPSLITPFYPNRIDCAAYTLSVGAEVFITEDAPPTGDPRKSVKFIVGPNEPFRIPPGQFAFLTTEEIVEVPADAIAFISMKATYKFRGLVNVSGFHVDPGWKGPLIFSVYNAGPATVHLSRGVSLFLIWYAYLDKPTQYLYKPKGTVGLKDDLVSNMSGQVFSPMNLSRQLDTFKEKLSAQFEKTREEQMQLKVELANFKKIAYVVGSALITVILTLLSLVAKPVWELTMKAYVEQQKTQESGPLRDNKNTSPSSLSPPETKGAVDQPPSHATNNTILTEPKNERPNVGAGDTPPASSDTKGKGKRNANRKPAEDPPVVTIPPPPSSKESRQGTH